MHTLAVKLDGTLWAWGYNDKGQIGDGTIIQRNSPTQIGSENNWKKVFCGFRHSIAMKNDGSLWAWGYNDRGQLGDGTKIDKKNPTQISWGNWRHISAGEDFTVAIKEDGTLWTWGDNFSTLPTQIGIDNDWNSISAGSGHVIAIKNNGNIYTWGSNSTGQLGNNVQIYTSTPTELISTLKWKFLSAGNRHSLSIDENNVLWAWGDNSFGQFGNGTTTNKYLPINISCATTFIKPILTDDICIYPNPTKDTVRINCNGLTCIKLYNYSGNSLLVEKSYSDYKEIDLSKFKTGIYILVIQNDKGFQSCKIFKE